MTWQADDPTELERLIDGELSFAEQRVCLEHLDKDPEGWRRLALGLLEEQAFRRELGTEQGELPLSTLNWVSSSTAVARNSQRQTWTKQACVAAICLLSLFAGMQWEHLRQERGVAENVVATNSSPADARSDHAIISAEDVPFGPEFLAAEMDATSVAPNDSARDRLPQAMKFVVADWSAALEMPLLEVGENEDDVAELLQQSAVTDEMRRDLEAAGYVIYENRKYVPVPLEDGREGIAPISEISVEYVGADEYQ